MNHSVNSNKISVPTAIGLIAMILIVFTKVVPSSQIAGLSVIVGIVFFFIAEHVEKTPNAESGLRFKTFFADIKKPGVIIWMLLPIVSCIATQIVGDLIFSGGFSAHVVGRTDSMLSFDKILLLIIQIPIAAFGEEIAWRGFFLGKSANKFPFWLCAVVSSVFFAAGHIAVGDFWLVFFDIFTIFIDSMIYAMVYRKSGNCLISTVSHILCNGVGVVTILVL